MLTGPWKNFDELEDNISYPELTALVRAQRERDERNMRFQAALKGIPWDEKKEDDPVEAAKRKAKAMLQGVDEETVRLQDVGMKSGFKVEFE